MFPAENMPGPMQNAAHFTLNYWAIEGYLDLIVRQVAVSQVLPISARLAAVGLVLGLVGFFLMRRRVRAVLA